MRAVGDGRRRAIRRWKTFDAPEAFTEDPPFASALSARAMMMRSASVNSARTSADFP